MGAARRGRSAGGRRTCARSPAHEPQAHRSGTPAPQQRRRAALERHHPLGRAAQAQVVSCGRAASRPAHGRECAAPGHAPPGRAGRNPSRSRQIIDRRAISERAGGPIDMVLDFLPREAAAAQVRAALLTVKVGGRVILMGGLRGDQGNLGLNYDWLMHNETTVRGVWMYGKAAIPRMVQMVRAGLIDLAWFELTEFALDDANEAVVHAAANSGPRQLTVLRPDWRHASA